ncbi:hypothetical protein OAN22_00300 [Alphaproteobacteria bacterium]|nr:hypothetical protein [Alphaproteobacteria bacterium]
MGNFRGIKFVFSSQKGKNEKEKNLNPTSFFLRWRREKNQFWCEGKIQFSTKKEADFFSGPHD